MTTENGKKDYWKSVNDYLDENHLKSLKENEFLEGVTDEFHSENLKGMSRRKFLAVLGASTAFAATACSDYHDKGEIVPYNKRPAEVLPGVANYYASTCTGCSNVCSILVKTREARPIKIDGNPDNPINKGKICTKGQASLLNLYDPERLKHPLKKGHKTSLNIVNKEILAKLQQNSDEGKNIILITDEVTSPTYNRLLEEFVKVYPTADVYSYRQFNQLNRINAWEKCYGTRTLPTIKWESAKIILSLEGDFIGKEGNHVENIRQFSESRNVIENGEMSRVYVAEGGMSLTGMNADYRLRIRPDFQYEFSLGLLNELIKRTSNKSAVSQLVKSNIADYALKKISEKINLNTDTLEFLVADLIKYSPNAIVYAGDSLDENVHVIVNLINELLSNKNLFDYKNCLTEQRRLNTIDEFSNLIKKIDSGKTSTIIFVNADSVYQFPTSLNLDKVLKKIETKIALTESENDTSALCDYVIPLSNFLESWGDHQIRTGIYSLQQPVISPIFNTNQKESILLSWIRKENRISDENYHKYLQNSFREIVYNKQNSEADFRTYWLSALHDGVVDIKTDVEAKPLIIKEIKYFPKQKSEWTVHIQESYFLGDGYYANNGWLQELPHPISKVMWDNYASIAPFTAEKLNLSNGDIIKMNTEFSELEIPVMIQPGLAEKHLTIETGYGRKIIGDVGREVGFNANVLTGKNNIIKIEDISRTDKQHLLASSQEHHSLDDTFVKDFHKIRKIIQEGTLNEYLKNPDFLHEKKHDIFSITKEKKYEGQKWAMAIDLNKCIGCAACVSSCNVENNIPVVGKDQVANGREMHWLRIDRYYSGTPEEPIASNQPMLCQHCDNAPCENVCPVNATNHSPDGLNQMAYNRCVGTRYCANNCPYKVRRFNFFNFRDHFENAYYDNELTHLMNNPEVTVRSRGVMEKCTFCVQRIMETRSEAIRVGRELKTDEVKTACQSACPADAIVFGDANDPDSKVSKLRGHKLTYHVLEELNVKPNITYLAKLRNSYSEENQ